MEHMAGMLMILPIPGKKEEQFVGLILHYRSKDDIWPWDIAAFLCRTSEVIRLDPAEHVEVQWVVLRRI